MESGGQKLLLLCCQVHELGQLLVQALVAMWWSCVRVAAGVIPLAAIVAFTMLALLTQVPQAILGIVWGVS